MLNYLEKTSRPEIAYAVHQCARFCEEPKLSHERAVHKFVRYLIASKDKGIIFRPDKSQGIVCHVNTDFASNWNLVEGDNLARVLSRTGFIITYANCPLIWASCLQTKIALSTTKAEYIALSQAMKEIIPLINILGEVKRNFKVIDDLPQIHCKLFEDNKSALALAKAPQMNPRTKYILLISTTTSGRTSQTNWLLFILLVQKNKLQIFLRKSCQIVSSSILEKNFVDTSEKKHRNTRDYGKNMTLNLLFIFDI